MRQLGGHDAVDVQRRLGGGAIGRMVPGKTWQAKAEWRTMHPATVAASFQRASQSARQFVGRRGGTTRRGCDARAVLFAPGANQAGCANATLAAAMMRSVSVRKLRGVVNAEWLDWCEGCLWSGALYAEGNGEYSGLRI